MSWLSQLFHWTESRLAKLWNDVSPTVKADLEKFAETFADIALAAVQKAALSTLTGQEKFGQAVSEVKDAVVAAGWQAGTTALNTLVQDVYQKVKAANGEDLVTPPAS